MAAVEESALVRVFDMLTERLTSLEQMAERIEKRQLLAEQRGAEFDRLHLFVRPIVGNLNVGPILVQNEDEKCIKRVTEGVFIIGSERFKSVDFDSLIIPQDDVAFGSIRIWENDHGCYVVCLTALKLAVPDMWWDECAEVAFKVLQPLLVPPPEYSSELHRTEMYTTLEAYKIDDFIDILRPIWSWTHPSLRHHSKLGFYWP